MVVPDCNITLKQSTCLYFHYRQGFPAEIPANKDVICVGEKKMKIISIIWTILLSIGMPVYFMRFQKELCQRRKFHLAVLWGVSVLVSGIVCIRETDCARAVALTGVLFLLASSAAIDYENKMIPNHLQFLLAGVGVIEYIILAFAGGEDFLPRLAGNLLTGFGIFAMLLMTALLSRGLGGGDVKLLSLLGCVCGYGVTVSTLLWALICSMIVSVVLLVRKQKGRKDTLPFVPFILLGYLISMAALY